MRALASALKLNNPDLKAEGCMLPKVLGFYEESCPCTIPHRNNCKKSLRTTMGIQSSAITDYDAYYATGFSICRG
jgi:hypothetical protein